MQPKPPPHCFQCSQYLAQGHPDSGQQCQGAALRADGRHLLVACGDGHPQQLRHRRHHGRHILQHRDGGDDIIKGEGGAEEPAMMMMMSDGSPELRWGSV